MTLSELQQLLDSARGPRDVFGDEAAASYKRWAHVCHPDRFPTGSVAAKWAAALFKRLGHWKTLAQSSPQSITSPCRTYTIKRSLGTGDLCDVHYAVSGDEGYVLKVPRVAGVNNLLAKEREVLEQLIEQSGDDLYATYFPQPVETFRADDRRINACRWRDGFHTAQRILECHPGGLDGRHLAWMFKRVLEAIGYAHRQGWIHGAVLPPHLMFHAENHGLQLLDWMHAARRRQHLVVAPAAFKSWYPPECQLRRAVTPSVDIYLAAKSLVYLSGGDPLSNAIPNRIPAAIQRFLHGCLLESPNMRPQDAWLLHDEFTQLLEDVYGPPKYHQLDMP